MHCLAQRFSLVRTIFDRSAFLRGKLRMHPHNAHTCVSEDMSTTAGCKEVMCVRRAYANSHHRGVASCTHLRRSLCRIWGGRFRVVFSAEKEVREGRSSSRVSRWNLRVNLPSTTFDVGHRHMMWSSSPRFRVPEARQYGHTRSW